MRRPKHYRPAIPVGVKLAALFLQQGMTPDMAGLAVKTAREVRATKEVLRQCLVRWFGEQPVELDHCPALALRAWDGRKGDTKPPANDPAYLVWRPKGEHAVKTFGRGGERRIHTKGSDHAAVYALKRIKEARELHHAAMRRKRPGKGKDPKVGWWDRGKKIDHGLRKWPKRKLPSRALRVR